MSSCLLVAFPLAQALEDVEVVTCPPSGNGQYEVVFPVCLPGEGTFDWADWFLQQNPHYAELSERMVVEWALRSGMYRPKIPSSKASNDRPEMNFGLPHLDDGTVEPSAPAIPAPCHDVATMATPNNLGRSSLLDSHTPPQRQPTHVFERRWSNMALNNPCFKQGIGIALAVALIGGPLFALMDIPDDPGLPLLAAWKT
eukprot:g26282.t1